jgi:hypothetical protein
MTKILNYFVNINGMLGVPMLGRKKNSTQLGIRAYF